MGGGAGRAARAFIKIATARRAPSPMLMSMMTGELECADGSALYLPQKARQGEGPREEEDDDEDADDEDEDDECLN